MILYCPIWTLHRHIDAADWCTALRHCTSNGMQQACRHGDVSIRDLISIFHVDRFGDGFFERVRGEHGEFGNARSLRLEDDIRSTTKFDTEIALRDRNGEPVLPLGEHIQVDLGDGVVEHPMREVVGVVGNIKRRSLTVEADPQYYLPYAQAVITNPFLPGGRSLARSSESRGIFRLQCSMSAVVIFCSLRKSQRVNWQKSLVR